MPSRKPDQDRVRLCFYGDSHLAAVKKAVDDGMLDTEGFEISFWGAEGPSFRQLRLYDDVIRPDTEIVERQIEKLFGDTQGSLNLRNVDVMIFVAARLRPFELILPIMQRMSNCPGSYSAAALYSTAYAWLNGTRSFRYAVEIQAKGLARCLYIPASLPTFGMPTDLDSGDQNRRSRNTKSANDIWGAMVDAAADQGLALFRQPPETIQDQIFTKPQFATKARGKKVDFTHKNSSYAALTIQQALSALA